MGLTEPGIITAEAPNPIVNELVILPDIEKRLEAFVRVLDEQHTAVGPWNPHLDDHDLQVGLRHMLLTRLFDQRMQRMQRQGKISFYMMSTGEEAVSVAQASALRPAWLVKLRMWTRLRSGASGMIWNTENEYSRPVRPVHGKSMCT